MNWGRSGKRDFSDVLASSPISSSKVTESRGRASDIASRVKDDSSEVKKRCLILCSDSNTRPQILLHR